MPWHLFAASMLQRSVSASRTPAGPTWDFAWRGSSSADVGEQVVDIWHGLRLHRALRLRCGLQPHVQRGEKVVRNGKITAAKWTTCILLSCLAGLNNWMGTLLACSVSEGVDLTNKLLNVSGCLADNAYSPAVAGQKIEASGENWTNIIPSEAESTERMKQLQLCFHGSFFC